MESIRVAGTLIGSGNSGLPFSHLQLVTNENKEIEVAGENPRRPGLARTGSRTSSPVQELPM